MTIIQKVNTMIETCARYGHKFNNEFVEHCPQCYPVKRRGKKRKAKQGEIQSFMRTEISSRKKVVNSYRSSNMAKWEREHGKSAI